MCVRVHACACVSVYVYMYVCVELKAEKELFVCFFETSFSVALEPVLQKELLNISAYSRLKTGILSITPNL